MIPFEVAEHNSLGIDLFSEMLSSAEALKTALTIDDSSLVMYAVGRTLVPSSAVRRGALHRRTPPRTSHRPTRAVVTHASADMKTVRARDPSIPKSESSSSVPCSRVTLAPRRSIPRTRAAHPADPTPSRHATDPHTRSRRSSRRYPSTSASSAPASSAR